MSALGVVVELEYIGVGPACDFPNTVWPVVPRVSDLIDIDGYNACGMVVIVRWIGVARVVITMRRAGEVK